MATTWTYADWAEQATDTARLARLRQHISEVNSAIAASVSADGKSRDSSVLKDLLQMLLTERDRLENSPSVATNGGISLVRMNRAR